MATNYERVQKSRALTSLRKRAVKKGGAVLEPVFPIVLDGDIRFARWDHAGSFWAYVTEDEMKAEAANSRNE